MRPHLDNTPSQSSRLSANELFRQKAFVDGSWVNADSGNVIAVINPATGLPIGTIPDMGGAETRRAIEAAEASRANWQEHTAHERSAILKKWHGLILDHLEDLAEILTTEQGKPLAEARGEIRYGASFVEWFAEEAKRIYGDTIPAPKRGSRILVLKQAIGVTAAITPWNFPIAMITRKCAPALAAGCPVIVKPSEFTPYSALALAELAQRAGVPDGVFNVVTGAPHAIGQELTSNPTVRKVSFTGSTRVGKLLMEQSASTVKKVSMELGGNAPLIVFDDANIDVAIRGALASKFRNSGQTCVCANRIFVQAGIYDEFARRLAAEVKSFKVADGFVDGSMLGPLINENAVEKVERHIEDALSKGAKLVTGGKRHALGRTFFEPTVLVYVSADMALAGEETFGPVAPLFRFTSEDEVVRLANATPFGLAAYVFTQDLDRMWRVTDRLETGMVGINDGLISNEVAPFGGIKESGLGREGSKYGIEEYLTLKYVLVTENA
ncbi:NAD-dependent succinate-semialdehyde dehydrogenase [Microvirga aerophila]|uniref:NAD-dependent succinate-semialdehyde dehydrogenase n=1 Tax=Microvirga aerophila TaxID=670291 RepID=A0A512BXQ4_9HYPH|nr:NAD-dependent succinate-semialdehyde dehydrogenase [Microvirga aerophila]GEO16723.1 NAD-dependent succinate-semialdehyde dehydrogenase [Microvirga aerophila]